MATTKSKSKAAKTAHKAGCKTFSGAAVTFTANHAKKMYVCADCGTPDSTPAMAKNAYKVMEEIAKVSKAVKAKVKRTAKKEAKAAKAAPEAAPVAAAVEASPAPKVEGEIGQ